MPVPIQWGRTEIKWSPAGYTVHLDVWLDTRASMLFAERVADALSEIDVLADETSNVRIDWTPGSHWERREGGRHAVGADPGHLVIHCSRAMFALDPQQLSDVLTPLALSCRAEADEQLKRDEELAEDWLNRAHALKHES